MATAREEHKNRWNDQTAVGFLSKRVEIPDQDDLKRKLSQTMHYLHFTQHLPLTLEVEKLGKA